MFPRLVSHNEDFRRLVEKGYAVGFDSNCLVVRDIPYLDAARQLQIGAIVAKVTFIDQHRIQQVDHQIFFAGGVPHGLDGRPIGNLGGGPAKVQLSPVSADVVVQRSFSNKPQGTGKFQDFFEKIESYVTIISGPAMEMHNANPLTFRVVEKVQPDGVFKIQDTLTSRAEIGELSAKFNQDVVAVIGLGGTGAYVLDLLAKTPVREIRAFDGDAFHVHTAFRSPGRLDLGELGQAKADVYRARYDSLRTGLKIAARYVDESCSADFDGVTFAFVCVDKGSSRAAIFDLLLAKKIPFIDVGMGLDRKHDALIGLVRTTYYSAESGQDVRDEKLAEMTDVPDNIYRTNIQIAELNALNACLAVIRFKQLRGFYLESLPSYHLLFDVTDLKIVGKSPGDQA